MRATSFLCSVFTALSLTGCVVDNAPTTQTSSATDETIAEIVAGIAGYESNGLAVTLSDAVAARIEGPHAIAAKRNNEGAATLTESVVAVDTGSPSSFSLRRLLNRSNLFSETSFRYRTHATALTQNVIDRSAPPLATGTIETSSDGIYRSGRLKLEGESRGILQLDDTDGADNWVGSAGEYQYHGSTQLHVGRRAPSSEEWLRYTDLTASFTWKNLSLSTPSAGPGRIIGQSDVTISASGPEGHISRSGTLVFNGSETALLIVGETKFRIDVRTGRYVGKS